MAMVTQYVHYRTATSGGLPKLVREPFDAKQRLHRHRRGRVEVEPPLGEWCALYLARMIKHGDI